jgi:hypothetical protein
MADVDINKFRASVVRDGSKPASPGFVVSEGQDPVNPPGTNNYVPYSGATANVELGEFGVEAGFITLDTTPTGTPTTQGTIYWDDARNTAALIMNGTIQHIGQDSFFYVKNSTGSSINKGVAVRFDGTDGASGHLKIAPFLADGTYPSTYFMGVTAEAIGNGEFGQVMHFGELEGINTSGFTAGDLLYASTTVAGGFQTTAPVAPNNIVLIAAAINSKNNGAIIVRPTYGSNINNDEGVKITTPTTGQLLQLQAGGLWENKTLAQVLGGTSSQFVKGDGSLDSTTYQNTADKGQPNGYASLDGNGKVPLTQINDALIGNVNFQGLWNASTNTPTLVDPPTSGTKGYYYIVSTGGTFAGITFEVGDWIISNGTAWGKVDNTDAVSSVFGRTGNVTASNGDYTTAQVTESGNLYFTNARAIASVLTGYTSGAGTISAADTILSAIQKLNGNIGGLVTGVSSVNGQTGVVTLTTTNIAEGTNLYYTEARVNANTNVAANTAARHNAVTLGTANGLSLSTQQLSLGLASAGVTGALSGTDWSTFNGKQNALTNPVTGTGTTNYLPKFTGTSTIGNSIVQDNGSTITVGGSAYIKAGNGNQLGLDNSGERFTQINFLNNTVSKANIWWDNTNTELVLLANSVGTGHLRIASTGAATFSSGIATNGYTASTSYAALFNGNVGIGTPIPDAKLDIIGASAASSPYLSKAIQFAPSNFPTRTWSLNYDDGGTAGYGFNISAASTKILYLNANGNVGIGTASPSQALSIGDGTSTKYIRVQGSVSDSYFGSDSLGTFIGNNSNAPIYFNTNGTEQMRIFSDGNVLIQSGGTFSNNGARLQVSGNATIGSGAGLSQLTVGSGAGYTGIVLSNNSGFYSWLLGSQYNVSNAFEITPSTALGGSTFTTPVFKITNTGAATFSSTVETTGIKFPASQVASADANTLDDYEEGTWSPNVDPQTGTYVMVFGSKGTYTKIGRVVTVQYYFRVVNKGTGSGSCILSNLPFASLTTSTDDSYTGTGIRQGNYLNTLVINQNSSSINITENTGDPIVQGQWNAGSITYFT